MSHTRDTGDPMVLYPTIFVIFGITGDLASRASCRRFWNCMQNCCRRAVAVGFSRRTFTREEFRELIHAN